MAELADALDLGSSSIGVGVQVLFPAPSKSPTTSGNYIVGGIKITLLNAGLIFILQFYPYIFLKWV